jgi:hypothetical protein
MNSKRAPSANSGLLCLPHIFRTMFLRLRLYGHLVTCNRVLEVARMIHRAVLHPEVIHVAIASPQACAQLSDACLMSSSPSFVFPKEASHRMDELRPHFLFCVHLCRLGFVGFIDVILPHSSGKGRKQIGNYYELVLLLSLKYHVRRVIGRRQRGPVVQDPKLWLVGHSLPS